LTNPTHTPEWDHRPRAEKRAADWAHIRNISDRGKRLKLIDRIDNMNGYRAMPINMLRKYIPESKVLIDICGYTNTDLMYDLTKIIAKAEEYVVTNTPTEDQQ
jgi:hypothetical protein